ncbi:hypothetical protein ACQPXT_01545 [Streptomyces sp. CA-100214]
MAASGTTLVAARSAQELQAVRVLVLVPSLELLAQIAAGQQSVLDFVAAALWRSADQA